MGAALRARPEQLSLSLSSVALGIVSSEAEATRGATAGVDVTPPQPRWGAQPPVVTVTIGRAGRGGASHIDLPNKNTEEGEGEEEEEEAQRQQLLSEIQRLEAEEKAAAAQESVAVGSAGGGAAAPRWRVAQRG
eukprot:COSAG01_NODE_2949_length_6803_cov_11.790784_4_plen_134_part_00